MIMIRWWAIAVLAALAMWVPGCVKANVRVPERIAFGSDNDSRQAPPEQIPPADASDPKGLAQENTQLRNRLIYVEKQLSDARKDLDDAEDRIADLQADNRDLKRKLEDAEEEIDDLKDRLD